jgi:hypothetical protein
MDTVQPITAIHHHLDQTIMIIPGIGDPSKNVLEILVQEQFIVASPMEEQTKNTTQ